MDPGLTNSDAPPASAGDDSGGDGSGGPVGTGNHVVAAGECMASIAFESGFFWETLWNHPDNAALKQARPSPNVLLVGDRVAIPDLRLKQQSIATGARSKFKLKGVPAKLKLQVTADLPASTPPPKPAAAPPSSSSSSPLSGLAAVASAVVSAITGGSAAKSNVTSDPDPAPPPVRQARANVPYLLDIDGTVTRGQTDGAGGIDYAIPPNARQGKLTLDPGTLDACVINLKLGHLDPITQVGGVKQRLANLGYDCGDVSDEPTDDLAAALLAFQGDHGLPTSGVADDATREKLKTLHGS